MQEQVVAFQLAEQIYGLEINSVREIIRFQPVMSIPEAPQYISGVISLRRRFGLPGVKEEASSRIIILDLPGVTAGIQVDAVLEVLRLEKGEIEAVPLLAVGQGADFVRGVARWRERLILLLEGAKLLTEREKEVMANLAAAG
ncbi:chemotaxis protein CheW [Neomoorella glycerini]|uniref:chemotaxis protein CheW n=1 Tax=Neomoorella glycerini TaxID=55779 RepID=UPI0014786D07|nr:chemotaxis protein CheW [Moorella glycerini]